MKILFFSVLFAFSIQAQNFSPSAGAGIQSSPSAVGGTTIDTPTGAGATTLGSPTTSGATSFTSPSGSVNDSTTPLIGTPPALSPTLPSTGFIGTDLGVGPLQPTPLDTVPSTINQSPNPLPDDINQTDAFESSLIQAQEARPLDVQPTTTGGAGIGTDPTNSGQ